MTPADLAGHLSLTVLHDGHTLTHCHSRFDRPALAARLCAGLNPADAAQRLPPRRVHDHQPALEVEHRHALARQSDEAAQAQGLAFCGVHRFLKLEILGVTRVAAGRLGCPILSAGPAKATASAGYFAPNTCVHRCPY